jgi:hypothetical protein
MSHKPIENHYGLSHTYAYAPNRISKYRTLGHMSAAKRAQHTTTTATGNKTEKKVTQTSVHPTATWRLYNSSVRNNVE